MTPRTPTTCPHCLTSQRNLGRHLRDTGAAEVCPDDACSVLFVARNARPLVSA